MLILSAGTVHGIAVDEVGVYRNIRRMPHGRYVVRKHLKTLSNQKTKMFLLCKILLKLVRIIGLTVILCKGQLCRI